MIVYRIPAKLGTEMRLYILLLCAKFQGNQISYLHYGSFVSVQKDNGKNEETKPSFEVSYLGNALSNFAESWYVEY